MHSKRLQTIMLMLAVTSICVMLLAILIYSSAADALKQEITSAYHVSLLHTRDRMETYLRHLDQTTLQFETVSEMERIIDRDDETSKNPIDAMMIMTVMLRIHAALEYVDNVAVYDTRTGILRSTNTLMNEAYGYYGSILSDFRERKESRAFYNTEIRDRPVVLYIRKMPAFSRIQPVFILYHINQRIFDDFLGEERYSDAGDYFIIDRSGTVLARRGPAGSGELQRWADRINKEKKGLPETGIGSFSSADSYVTFLPESFDGWIYAFGIPNRVFLHRLFALRNITIAVTAALLLSSIVISIFSSRWLWSGWKKIRTLVDDGSGLKAGSANEFDAVFSRVMTVVEQSRELRIKINEILPTVKDVTMFSFLENGLRTGEDWKKAEELRIPLHPGMYACLCVEPDRTWEAGKYNERDISTFEYAILTVIREILEKDRSGFSVRMESGCFFALVSSRTTDPSELLNLISMTAERIRIFIGTYFPFTVSIGISGIRLDFRYTNIACREAREILHNKHISGMNRTFLPSLDRLQTTIEPFPISEIENDILYGIKTRNYAYAEAALYRLNEVKHIPGVQYAWLQGKLVETAQSIFRRINRTLDEPVPDPVLNELLELITLENWIDWFRLGCIEPFIERLEGRHRTESAQAVKNITVYIRERLESYVRLEDCATDLKIPVSFAKQALKEVLNTTFTELVLSERIERAKEFLKDESLSVNAIAHRLCYSNAQNFSRTFKKAVGMSPGHYRTKHA